VKRSPGFEEEVLVAIQFPMIPATAGPYWLFAIIGIIMLGVLVVFATFAYSSRHTVFEIRPDGLEIKGTLYGRTIPASSLIPEQAKVVDLSRDRDYRLSWRTNGAGLPGYAAGWFRTKGKQKVLAFVTDQRRTVYVPTRDGYAVLLSVAEPGEFISQLRAVLSGSTT
jgi:hypothetical protein